MLCKVLHVNRSTYYKHFYSEPAPRIAVNQQIKSAIVHIYSDYDHSLGAYKIHHVLKRDYGITISVGRVYRLMAGMALPKMSTDTPKYKPAPIDGILCVNHLNQGFNPDAPNMIWVSDFTYIKVNGRFNYLCIVIALFARKIIGWNVSSEHSHNLVQAALQKAYTNREFPKHVLFHSDQGSEYKAFSVRKLLDRYQFVQSFSKKGYPYDNACCESFFKQMKRECLLRRTFYSTEQLRLTCFEYIQRYNSKRPHASLGYLTPNEVEEAYHQMQG